MLQEMRETDTPDRPVVVSGQNYPLMRVVLFLQAPMQPTAVGRKDIRRTDIDGEELRGIKGQLFFMQNRREKSHFPYPLRAYIGQISRHSRAITQSCYHTIGRDIVKRIHHFHKVAQRVLECMLMTQTRITEYITQPVSVRERSLLNRPFIAIGHNENHGFATPFGDHRSKGIDTVSPFLPSPFIPVDAMDEVEDGQGFRTLVIRVRHIDIHAAKQVFVVAVPYRMDDLRRFACRGVERRV